ncbi:MAG: GumC family protein [Mangrovicoccus sp.]
MNIDFSYYSWVFWRRFPYFVVIAALFTSIGLAVALVLPPSYRAAAIMLMESQQIPSTLAATTVDTQADEQLQILEQRLMTRANLLDIASRLDVFDNPEEMTASEIVEEMRGRTSFATSSGRNKATFLTISFEADQATLASTVTNEFVTLVMQENVDFRTRRAEDTMEFFQQEVARLGAELDRQSAELLEFKSENQNALPDILDFLRDREDNIREALLQINRDRENLTIQRQNAIQLFQATGATGSTLIPQTPLQQQLQTAKSQLEAGRLIYSADNPRLTRLETRYEALLKASTADSDGTEEKTVTSQGDAVLNAQLNDIDQRLRVLDAEEESLRAVLSEIEGNLSQIPANSITLDGLLRDYQALQNQYDAAVSRMATAATGERIELLSKGQRISIVEQATPPENPYKPNRAIIGAAGLGAGITAGFGFIVLLELMSRSIRRPAEISDKLGIAPFAVLPYINNKKDAIWKRSVTLGLVIGMLIGIPLILLAFHEFVLPLPDFAERLLNRIGMTMANG